MKSQRGILYTLTCLVVLFSCSARSVAQDFPPEFVRVAEALRGRVIPDLSGRTFVEFTSDKRRSPLYALEREKYVGWLFDENGDFFVLCVHGTYGKALVIKVIEPRETANGVGIENYHVSPDRFSMQRPDVIALMFFIAGEKKLAKSVLRDREDWSQFSRTILDHFVEVFGAECREQYDSRNYDSAKMILTKLEFLVEALAVSDRRTELKDRIDVYKRDLERRYANPSLEHPNIKEILKLPADLKYQGLIDALTNSDGSEAKSLYAEIKAQGKSMLPYLIRAYGFDNRLSRNWGKSGFGVTFLPSTVGFICFNYLINLMPEEFKGREGFGTPEFRREKALRLLKN